MGCVDGAPAGLGGLDQLERHRDAGGPGAGALGDPLAQPDGGEGRLDRVRGAQVDPVLGGEVVERQQHVEVVGDLRDGLGPLGAVARPRTPSPPPRRGPCPRRCRSPPAPPSRRGAPTSAARRGRCRSCATSTAARAVSGNTSRSAFQNPSAPSPTASTGARIPRRLQSRSRSAHDSAGLAEPVGQRDQLLAAVGADPDHHQQAHLVLLQADLQVDAVDPHVHVVACPASDRFANAVGLVLPLRGQPGDRGRATGPRSEPRNCSNAGPKSPEDRPCRYSSGSTSATRGRLPRPRRQDRRGEPLPLTGHLVDALVVDPRLPHRHRPGRRGHLPPAW